MSKSDLLFYDAYEEFYAMTRSSKAFETYSKDAFQADFSQDGFSNKEQVDMILPYIPHGDNIHILDIGCGNGKMVGYLQEKTGAYIHGFDYSEEAIRTAQMLFPDNAEFREGVIGQIDYPEAMFDVITSMDTMYFAEDMTAFVSQIKKWLKPDGIFFVGYQEGDVIPKTENIHTSLLTKALAANDMKFEATDMTEQTYELLNKKRIAAIKHKAEFEKEGNLSWYDMLIGQTDVVTEPFEQFKEKMARYIYVARKQS